eukprot:366124-Chlamydomonas_euryale.AAC.24
MIPAVGCGSLRQGAGAHGFWDKVWITATRRRGSWSLGRGVDFWDTAQGLVTPEESCCAALGCAFLPGHKRAAADT